MALRILLTNIGRFQRHITSIKKMVLKYTDAIANNRNVHSVIGRDVHPIAQESPRAC